MSGSCYVLLAPLSDAMHRLGKRAAWHGIGGRLDHGIHPRVGSNLICGHLTALGIMRQLIHKAVDVFCSNNSVRR